MTEPAMTLVVADDHPLYRSALRETVRRVLPNARVIEAENMQDLRAAFAQQTAIDLVLLDLRMPGVQGFSSLMELRAEHPEVPVIVVSAAEQPAIIARVRDFGAAGFIPKSAPAAAIAEAIAVVLRGATWFPPLPAADPGGDPEVAIALRLATLTPQQLRVLGRLGAGRLNKQIAGDLQVTEATVKAHMTMVLRKLGFHRRTQAALLAQRLQREDAPSLWSADLAAVEGEPEGEG